ncbi:MAG: hypothetical protein Q4A79_00245 [Candidatus Saccharibacteria bacterium]|nr:hypothetical protein [Candidatus Saccharibacteria bacterium]
MRKVILKCRLDDVDRFEKKLSEIGLDFGPIVWQHDRIYVPRGYKHGANLPRLIMRTEMYAIDRPPVYSLTLKRHIEDSGVDIIEDTAVVDYVSVVNMILQLGFKQAGEVSRRRQGIIIDERDSIFLDEIDKPSSDKDPEIKYPSAGNYAKLETILKSGESVAEVRKEIRSTFESLGEFNIIESPYFEL